MNAFTRLYCNNLQYGGLYGGRYTYCKANNKQVAFYVVNKDKRLIISKLKLSLPTLFEGVSSVSTLLHSEEKMFLYVFHHRTDLEFINKC